MELPDEDDKPRERHLKLRQVEVFLVAARTLNFGAAAAELRISPAALSQAISDLERNLGARLFTRDASGASLTAAGNSLVAHGARLLRAEDAARRAVVGPEAQLDQEPVRIRVAHDHHFASIVADATYALVQAKHVLVIAQAVDSRTAHRMVEDGEAELGLAYAVEEANPILEVTQIARTRLSVIAAGRALAATTVGFPLGVLATGRLALPWEDGKCPPEMERLRLQVEQYFQKSGISPRRVVFRGTPQAVLDLVRMGAAITLHTSIAIARDPQLHAARLNPKPAWEAVNLVQKRDAQLPEEVAMFARNIRIQQEQAVTSRVKSGKLKSPAE